ncbi:MAG: hypothetical protein NVV59_06145 [Chitinophagaceae bacterium]|nr:hypothetical protein [Chitinophagaceae bacterium]
MKRSCPLTLSATKKKIISAEEIQHYNFHTKEELLTNGFLPAARPLRILITSGASCPDAIVEAVIRKLVELLPATRNFEEVRAEWSGEA